MTFSPRFKDRSLEIRCLRETLPQSPRRCLFNSLKSFLIRTLTRALGEAFIVPGRNILLCLIGKDLFHLSITHNCKKGYP